MANNNIRLDIDVRGKGLLEAIKSTDSLEKNMKRLSDTYGRGGASYQQYYRAVQKLAEANGKSTKELLNHGKALRADTQAAKAYKDMIRQADAENRKFDQSVKQQAQSLHRLKMSTDASYAATNKLQAAKRVLKKEVEQGRMNAEQYVAAMRKVVQANKAAEVSAQLLGKRTSRFGVLAQQTGYQVGDFLVQVQSGQNIMVAFGQQATQLVGTFSMLAKSTMAIGALAGLGILIPILTGIGAAFLRTKEAADSSSLAIKAFEERLKAARSGTRDMAESLRLLKSGFETEAELAYADNILKARDNLKLAKDALDEYNLSNSDKAGGGDISIERTVLQDQVDLAKEKLALARDEAKQARAVAQAHEAETRRQERNASVTRQLHEVRQQILRDQREYNELVTETARSQNHQLTVLQNIYALGEDSVRVAELRAEEEARVLELNVADTAQYVARALLIRNEIAAIVRKTEAQKAFDASVKAAAASYDRLVNQSSSLDVEIAKVDAQIKALKNNTDVATAAYIAGERAKITSTYETTRALAVQNNNMILLAQNAIAYAEALGKLDTLENAKLEFAELSDVGGGGGGGSKKDPAEEFAEYLEGLKQQAEIEGKLVGLFGEKREIEKAVLEARNKYGPAFADQQESELRATLQLIDAEKERQRVLEEAQADQQSIADTLQSSMSDAFMSMVEGTKSFKDAMKDMARAVIKQLYDVLVVQQMVGSFDKASGTGTGIMGFLGSILGQKASGGTVMSNQPYLVGEKGPELIVPRNRGHVMNADLTANAMGGSGGSVVVNQSFNFQANGDDSVKKIIAQAAPSIANMAKQSVMDARRRGGSMKNTFG